MKKTRGGAREGAGAKKKKAIRDIAITTLLYPEEREKIIANAEKCGMSVAGFVRSRCIYDLD